MKYANNLPLTVLLLTQNLHAASAGRVLAHGRLLREWIFHVLVAGWAEGELTPRLRDFPVLQFHGELRSQWPLDAVVVYGEQDESTWQALLTLRERFGTRILTFPQDSSESPAVAARACPRGLEYVANFDHLQRALKTGCGAALWSPALQQTDVIPQRSKPGRRDIVLFWKQNDLGLYGRRPDMVIRYLATRPDVGRIVVFDRPYSEQGLEKKQSDGWFNQNRYVYVGAMQRALSNCVEHREDCAVYARTFVYRPEREGSEEYVQFVRESLAELDVNIAASLFIHYPLLQWGEELMAAFQPRAWLADIVDDRRTWPHVNARQYEKYTHAYQVALAHSQFAMTNCEPVQAAMASYHDSIALLPNGCDEQPPLRVSTLNRQLIRELQQWTGPVFIYVGNLESKLDDALLEKIATTYTNALLVLVGSAHTNRDILDLECYANVRFSGVLPYAEANAVLQYAHVGLVPHRQTALTEHMNPLKVSVYLTNRLPVVASQVSNIAEHPCILRASDHETFLQQLDVALSLYQQRDEPRLQTAFLSFQQDNAWQTRLAPYFDALLTDESAVEH